MPDSAASPAPHFYALDLPTRQRLVEQAAQAGETLVFRWATLASEATDSWLARAEQAAALIGPQRSVIDLGCGMMTLERFLPPGTTYIPVDVVARDARTLVVDLNRDGMPALSADCLVGLGILEYVYDLPRLLQGIAASCLTALLSYNTLERFPDRAQRTGHAWVNHHTQAELEALIQANGLRIVERIQLDTTQTMWRLARA